MFVSHDSKQTRTLECFKSSMNESSARIFPLVNTYSRGVTPAFPVDRKKILFVTSSVLAVGAATLLSTGEAIAQCTEASSSPANTKTVNCSGTVSDTIKHTSTGNITVNITSSASINVAPGSPPPSPPGSPPPPPPPTTFNAIDLTASGGVSVEQATGGNIIIGSGHGLIASVNGGSTGGTASSEAVLVSLSGNIEGKSGDGIRVTQNGKGRVSLDTFGVSGSVNGIWVRNASSEDTTITVKGAIIGSANHGIYSNNTASGSVSVNTNASATVTGGKSGMYLKAGGSGNVVVSASALVEGKDGDGIRISTTGTGELTISAARVKGSMNGIWAQNDTNENLTISVNAAIEGRDNDGIYANNLKSGNLTLSANSSATVSGGKHGLNLKSSGSGHIVVTSSAAIIGKDGDGIRASKTGTGEIRINAANVSGSMNGIWAKNDAQQNMTVSATGAIRGNANNGIYLHNLKSGNVVLSSNTSGTITGGEIGVYIKSENSGNVVVNASGEITGRGSAGIKVSKTGTGEVTVNTVGVTGSANGIWVDSNTKQHINISSNGNISGSGGIGIYANKQNEGNIVVIAGSAGRVVGGTHGIYIKSTGSGNVTLTSSTGVQGQIVGDGIRISATNTGNTTVTVNNSAKVEGKRNGLWINKTQSGSLTISTHSVASDDGYGVYAKNSASGAIRIETTGRVESKKKTGIHIDNSSSGGFITANAFAGVQSEEGHGVYIKNAGGDVTLNTSGEVRNNRSANNVDAIRVNDTGNGKITITASSEVKGARYGIFAKAEGTNGSGHFRITVSGEVTGSSSDGIYAANKNASGTYVRLEVGAVNGERHGIHALQYGTGDLTISTTGNVESRGSATTNVGIYAKVNENSEDGRLLIVTRRVNSRSGSGIIAKLNSTDGDDLSISAESIEGAIKGVDVVNKGRGNTSISASNSISGGGGAGVTVKSEGSGDIRINARSVSGSGDHAIYAEQTATGNITISVTGEVNSVAPDKIGVLIKNVQTSNDVTISVGKTTGGKHGIYAKTKGDGRLSISASGDVTSSTNHAIYAHNTDRGNVEVRGSGTISTTGQSAHGITAYAKRGGVTVNAQNVTGVINAIYARAEGQNADVRITVSGVVKTATGTASNFIAIDTQTNGGRSEITLNSGTVLGTPDQLAIKNDEGRATVTLFAGATLSGNIELGLGRDEMKLSGGELDAKAVIDGGVDPGIDVSEDQLTIDAGVNKVSLSRIRNFDRLNLNRDGVLVLAGDQELEIPIGTSQGTISMKDGEPDDELTVKVDYPKGGKVEVDVNFETGKSDKLIITDNRGFTGGGKTLISVVDVSGTNAKPQLDEIEIIKVDGRGSVGKDDVDIDIENNVFGGIPYSVKYNDNSKSFSLYVKDDVLLDYRAMALISPVVLIDGFARVRTLAQRTGLRTASSPDFDTDNGAWVNIDSGKFDYGKLDSVYEYESSNFGFQAGYNFSEIVGNVGQWALGVTSQYRVMDMDLKGVRGAANMSSTGYGIGAVATWFGLNNSYIDLQAQYNLVKTDYSSFREGDVYSGSETGAMVLSAEFGKRWRVDPSLTFVPQAQFSVSNVGGDEFKTNSQRDMKFKGESSFLGRVGMGAEYDTYRYMIYGSMNYWYDSLNSWNLSLGTGDDAGNFEDEISPTSFEYRLGGALAISSNSTLFMEFAKRSASGGDKDSSASNFSMGVNWSW